MAIAYESNTDLAFDTNVLTNCAKKYKNIASELRTMSKQLDSCLSNLASKGWTTPAGTAFQEMADTNWSQNIEKYAALLDTLSSILTKASSQYESLANDYIHTTKVKI